MKDNTFNFFDLPREMRDEVYDRLRKKVDIAKHKRPYYHIWTPIAAMRLISKQFEAEYDDRSPQHCELRVVDRSGWAWQDPNLPRRATNTTLLNIELCFFTGFECLCDSSQSISSPCDVAKETTNHVGWINRLVHQLPQLHTANMVVKLASPRCLKTLLDRCHELVNVAMLEKLDVHCFHKAIADSSPSLLVATWSRGHKMEIREDAVEKCRKNEFPEKAKA